MADGLRETYYMTWRVESGGGRSDCEGWYIQIPYSRNGERLTWRKLVSKARYGGTKRSLKTVALAIRDAKMDELQVYDPGLGIYHRKRSSRNTSGQVGIRLSEETRGGRVYFYWEARWREPDKRIARRVFSVLRYGSKRAQELAVTAREDALKRRGSDAKKSR